LSPVTISVGAGARRNQRGRSRRLAARIGKSSDAQEEGDEGEYDSRLTKSREKKPAPARARWAGGFAKT